MRGVIIAGGISKRLRPKTCNIPKTLLKLDQKVILEHILDAAYKAGITHFDILTGHGHDYVKGFMKLYQEHYPDTTFDLWFIERYQETGNVIALQAAQHLFDQEMIIINSDTVFHSDLIKKLLHTPEKNAMLIDDYKKLGAEEMKVMVDNDDQIVRIHKSLDPLTAEGEYVGLLKFSPDSKQQLQDATKDMMQKDESVYYEDAIQKAIDDYAFKIKKISTDNLPVMEIDTPEDLATAHDLIKKII
ncbi:MAG: hypothetical protein A2233_05135 [Candidatus Kerfeldbacteria bacterium RIFOXYA2_FULL_38_24]|uniref:Nucleotidyl transferase domain-containing protein n=1 Tax=Candidatus Kerfeldbacteria bacterium RIFOXYB2_FULL_38_14 TaxID=1798547 RepID=A0A1G2BGM9_9BACT|nr:MAG: hypothetical protein A2233_05135 [Candidatus Kerfeldbacteria bacterium RIFOXYA2_FULL_38_24]OGY88215.1 MAG: hypothetical protein A2319_03430 [Candidatus Kerfeldbacteria bacterium RIFOXYB2_FULL_38_14]